MAIYDLAAAAASLKELYDGQTVENLVYKNNPTLALIPKKTDFGGKYKPIPVITGASQGRSASFANAQANQSAAQIESFLLTRKADYSIATIDNQTMMASKTDKYAFLEGAKVVIDGAIRAATLSLASGMFRSGTGTIGRISGSLSPTGVVTLADPNSVTQFEVNQVLCGAATDGGAVGSYGVGYVVAVNRTAGTISVAASMGGTAATPSNWADGVYLSVQGDLNAKISGFQAWLPATAPSTSDNYYGVNRSPDSRLYGTFYNGASQTIEEALIDASKLIEREGGTTSHCPMSFASFSALQKALGSKVQYENMEGPAGLMFKSIVLNGANSEIKVYADRNCPGYTAFMLQMDTWTLQTLGDAPQILTYADGNDMLRIYNQDAAELRVGMYGNLACNAPGWSGQVSLGA